MPLAANTTRFEFEVDGCPDELRVAGFSANETLSRLFQTHVELAVENPEIDFEQIIGKAGVLSIIGEEESRNIHGIVSRFEQISVGDRFSTYHAVLVPAIWYLGHRYNSRIFQKMSVKDIVTQILDELGLPSDQYRWSLNGTPPQRDYCVQYRESELNFVQRLLEEEGIYYYFEHDEFKHTLVMGDAPSGHIPILGDPTLNYHEARPGQVPDEEFIFNFRYREEIRPGKVTLKDYNFRKPSLNLKGEKQADKNDELEVYDYPAEFEDPGRGTNLAKVRLEEQQAVRKVGNAATVTNRLMAGATFTLAEHPRDSFNKKYLITELHTSGQQPQVYEELSGGGGASFSVNFQFIPYDTPYRPARITPKPVVEGSQTAIVVGPSGEEIYTDEHGRIKVQFHWDREGQMDENSSCWIRVSQAWAGAGWGAMIIPRIGHEVIVDFIEGDPDRPIITGRVYHGTNRSPYPLPNEKTKSTLKSNSSKGGGGYNELRFEDLKSQEEVYLQAEKDWNTLVKNNRSTNIGANDSLSIGVNRSKTVGKDETNTIQKNRTTTVAEGDDTLSIGSNRTKTIGKNETINIQQNRSTTLVDGDDTLSIGANATTAIKGAFHTTIDGESGESSIDSEELDSIKKNAKIGALAGSTFGALGSVVGAMIGGGISAYSAMSDGPVSRSVTIKKGDDAVTLSNGSKYLSIKSGDNLIQAEDGSHFVKAKNIVLSASNSITLQCGGATIAIDAAGNIIINGTAVQSHASVVHDIKGNPVTINC